MGFRVSGLGVWGLGFTGLGFTGLGFRGLGFRVYNRGLGFRVPPTLPRSPLEGLAGAVGQASFQRPVPFAVCWFLEGLSSQGLGCKRFGFRV